MTVETALFQGRRLLEEGGIPVPRLTAEVLLCHAVGCERSYLYGHPEQELSEAAWLHYGRYLHQRLEGKPTQYITRQQEFYGRMFRVTPDVLIPRPETEHVIETALSLADDARIIVDVGCGSGAIAITLQLEMQSARVWATDISMPALAVAADNARRLGAKVRLVACDLAAAFRETSIDLLVSNPPYVPRSDAESLQREVRDYEPHQALFAGDTGLEIYEHLVADAARVLHPDGWLIMELGIRTLAAVRQMLGRCWQQVQVRDDLSGLPRVLAARYVP
jgi:release factor glutamine methyltransferase